MAASRTRWQSEHDSKWRLISTSTDEESRPSKYQQIKWMVSLQLISPVPPGSQRRLYGPSRSVHFSHQIQLWGSKYYLLINQRFSQDYNASGSQSMRRVLKRLHVGWFKCAASRHKRHYRCGVTVISRRAWIRFSRGGCVLNREDRPPLPNNGFTMHNAEVDGENEVVCMRSL